LRPGGKNEAPACDTRHRLEREILNTSEFTGSLLSKKFSSRRRVLLFLFLLYLLCVVVSNISYYFINSIWVFDPFGQATVLQMISGSLFFVLFWLIVASPLSLPLSLAELSGLSEKALLWADSPVQAVYHVNPWIIIGLFWAVVVTLVILLFWKRYKYLYVILVVIFLMCSIYWIKITENSLLV